MLSGVFIEGATVVVVDMVLVGDRQHREVGVEMQFYIKPGSDM